MASKVKQYYGIKFPFTTNNLDGFFIDLNETVKDKVASEILHVILTPKKTRLRMPDFGTNLAHYIFEPNDDITWDSVISEATDAIEKYVANARLDNLRIINDDEHPMDIYLDIYYTVIKGNTEENNRLVVKL